MKMNQVRETSLLMILGEGLLRFILFCVRLCLCVPCINLVPREAIIYRELDPLELELQVAVIH